MELKEIGLIILNVVIIIVALLSAVAFLVWLERKLVARIQQRIGPKRVGPFGLLQPLADIIKLLFKEDILPDGADRFLYFLAPAISLTCAIAAFAPIPITAKFAVSDMNIGVLYILAVASLGIYGIILGGWSAQSKYPLLGALRSSAQIISYELAMGLSLVAVFMVTGTLKASAIVEMQNRYPFVLLLPLSFLIFFVCALAETNRAPFDLPEAETELVAGFHTEYSSMKFAMYFMSEYINMVTFSALMVTLFWGGWKGPFLPPIVWFMLKVFIFLFIFIWLRATLPRLRYDRLMRLGWKFLVPLSLANIAVVGVLMASFRGLSG